MAFYSSRMSLLLHGIILKGSCGTESRNLKKGGYSDVFLVSLQIIKDLMIMRVTEPS